MAQSTKIQAACVLLLLLASLTSSTLLQQLARQPEALQPEALQPEALQPEALQPEALQPELLQPQDGTEARADMSFLIPNRKKRDTNFPICLFCCGCCNNRFCGICCKT